MKEVKTSKYRCSSFTKRWKTPTQELPSRLMSQCMSILPNNRPTNSAINN